MPHVTVPAAAKGVPIMHTQDQLLNAIRAYRSALEDFNSKVSTLTDDEVDAYAEVSYAPHLARLQQWVAPATSMEGAVEALRISLDDQGGVADCDGAQRMIAAALAYLDKAGTNTCNTSATALIVRAQDVVSEARDVARLLSMAIGGLHPDDDVKALAAGTYDLERKLVAALDGMEDAKTARR